MVNMEKRPFQIRLSNLMLVTFWVAAACACLAAALRLPRLPNQGLSVWPGMIAPCFLGAVCSFIGRPKTGIAMAVLTGVLGILSLWMLNRFWLLGSP